MPIHDWTRVGAGTYHNFHQNWTIRICDALNAGLLPRPYFAMADSRVASFEPDVIAVRPNTGPKNGVHKPGGIAVLERPPLARMHKRIETDDEVYIRKSNRISVRDENGVTVSIIEVVSPGNKHSRDAFAAFTRKLLRFLKAGVHVLTVDLFPPTKRDPNGVPSAIWRRLTDEVDPLPPGKSRTAASFEVGAEISQYFEPFAVGDPIPEMPLFLEPGYYVPLPLESTYQTSWNVLPEFLRERVAGV